MICWSNPRGES